MDQTTTALRLTDRGGAEYAFLPSSPLSAGAGASYEWQNASSFFADDANCLYVETTGPQVEIKLGSRTRSDSAAQAYNGVRRFSDMSVLRKLLIRAVSTAPQYAPAWTGDAGGQVTLAYLSDCGQPGANQTAAANRMASWTPDATLAVGDWTYNFETSGSAGANSDLAVFNAQIAAETFFPGQGNHEKAAGLMAYLDSKFGSYITEFGSPATYYERLFYGDNADADPLIQYLCLDSGLKTDGTLWPDAACGGGLAYGSAQWAWIRDRIRSVPNARYRIFSIHHPPTTTAADTQETLVLESAVSQLARSGWFDLGLLGHIHTYERFDAHGCPLVNASSCVRTLSAPGRPKVGVVGGVNLISHSTERIVCKIVATPDQLTLQAYSLTGALVDEFSVTPKAITFGDFAVTLKGLNMADGVPTNAEQTFRVNIGSDLRLSFEHGHPCHATEATIRAVTAPMFSGDTGDHYCRNLKLQILAVGA